MIYWLVDHVRFLFCSSFSGWEWPQGKNSSKLRTKSWITRYRILYNQSCICRIVLFMNLFSLVWFCVLYVCAVDASIFSICIVLFLLMWSIRWKISKFIRSVGESYLLIYILFYVSFSNLQSSSSLRSIGNCFAFLLPFLFIVFFIFCWMIRHCRLWRARAYECVCVCSSSDQRTDDDEPWTGAAISFFISEFFFFCSHWNIIHLVRACVVIGWAVGGYSSLDNDDDDGDDGVLWRYFFSRSNAFDIVQNVIPLLIYYLFVVSFFQPHSRCEEHFARIKSMTCNLWLINIISNWCSVGRFEHTIGWWWVMKRRGGEKNRNIIIFFFGSD